MSLFESKRFGADDDLSVLFENDMDQVDVDDTEVDSDDLADAEVNLSDEEVEDKTDVDLAARRFKARAKKRGKASKGAKRRRVREDDADDVDDVPDSIEDTEVSDNSAPDDGDEVKSVQDISEEIPEDQREEDEQRAEDDAEVDNVNDADGSDEITNECNENANAYTLEMIGVTYAFNEMDKVFTESYQTAINNNQKEALSESFKDGVKKYWERFKSFIIRVINMIKRAAIRIVSYIKDLFYRLQRKFLADKEVIKRAQQHVKDSTKKIEVKSYKKIDRLLAMSWTQTVLNKIFTSSIKPIANIAQGKKVDKAKNLIKKAKEALEKDKSEIIEELIGDTDTVKIDKKLLDAAIGFINKGFDAARANVNKAMNESTKVLDTALKGIKNNDDVNSEEMAERTGAVNLISRTVTSIYNLYTKFMHISINQSIRIVRAAAGADVKKADKKDKKGKKKQEEKKESYIPSFENFMAVL